ncbi:hypothetical protein LTS18_013769, partial [Coniosporium uncinatum]
AVTVARIENLRAVHRCTQVADLPPTQIPDSYFECFNYPLPPSPAEYEFLDQNDLTRGRPFNNATLRIKIQESKQSYLPPVLPPSKATVHPPSPSPSPAAVSALDIGRPPYTPTKPEYPSNDRAALGGEVADGAPSHGKSQSPSENGRQDEDVIGSLRLKPDGRDTVLLPSSEDPRTTDPEKALPLTGDDAADIVGLGQQAIGAGAGSKPSRSVHLPPQIQQEKRQRDVEREQDNAKRKERKEDDVFGLSGAADVASSPSSTIGAHSTFTPKATAHSPDTSPDEGSFVEDPDNVLAGRSTSQQPRAQVDEQQPESTQKVPVPDSLASTDGQTSPDSQLRLEEMQATRIERESLAPNVSSRKSSLKDGVENVLQDARLAANAQATSEGAGSMPKEQQ